MDGWAVRPARPEDEGAVVALWRECGLVVPWNDPGADFRLALGREASDVLAGFLDGALAASAMVGHDGHRAWLYYVAVRPDLRSRGFGRRMVEAGEGWARRRGVRKIQLMVRSTNGAALGFYGRLGYRASPVAVVAKWLDGTDQ
jgi:ribosomal protein S18 acetylase RimI-like enzyme